MQFLRQKDLQNNKRITTQENQSFYIKEPVSLSGETQSRLESTTNKSQKAIRITKELLVILIGFSKERCQVNFKDI